MAVSATHSTITLLASQLAAGQMQPATYTVAPVQATTSSNAPPLGPPLALATVTPADTPTTANSLEEERIRQKRAKLQKEVQNLQREIQHHQQMLEDMEPESRHFSKIANDLTWCYQEHAVKKRQLVQLAEGWQAAPARKRPHRRSSGQESASDCERPGTATGKKKNKVKHLEEGTLRLKNKHAALSSSDEDDVTDVPIP